MLGGPEVTYPYFTQHNPQKHANTHTTRIIYARWAGGYNPYFLDDPEMRISKDRTVIKQEGYVSFSSPPATWCIVFLPESSVILIRLSVSMCVQRVSNVCLITDTWCLVTCF